MRLILICLALCLIPTEAEACDGDRWPCPKVEQPKPAVARHYRKHRVYKAKRRAVHVAESKTPPKTIEDARKPLKLPTEIIALEVIDWPVRFIPATIKPSPSSTLPVQNTEIVYLEPPPLAKSDREDRPMWNIVRTEPGFAFTLFAIWFIALYVVIRYVHCVLKPKSFQQKGTFYDRLTARIAVARALKRARQYKSQGLSDLRYEHMATELGFAGRQKLRETGRFGTPAADVRSSRKFSPLGAICDRLRPEQEWWHEANIPNPDDYRKPLGG